MKLKAVPKEVLELDIHQSLDYRKIEIVSKSMSPEQLREMLLVATKTTMKQQNIIKFLMVKND